jgi:hypothetical protein
VPEIFNADNTMTGEPFDEKDLTLSSTFFRPVFPSFPSTRLFTHLSFWEDDPTGTTLCLAQATGDLGAPAGVQSLGGGGMKD